MDQPPPVSSSQKTSPATDPATVQQLTTELTAQATVLAVHQRQLDRLTSLTEDLVKALQALQLPSQTTPSHPLPAAPAAAAAIMTPPAVMPATTSPRLAFPEKFDGSPDKCKGFLLQCSLFVNQQPHLYPNDNSRIVFVCSLLTGRALDWATAVWDHTRPVFPSFAVFLQRFQEVFQPSTAGGDAGEQLLSLRQGNRTAADYVLSFRTLAAQSGFNDVPLKLLYRKGLNSVLQAELACRDEGASLDHFIDLSIRLDTLIRARRPPRTTHNTSLSTWTTPATAEAAPEPMQIGTTRLTLEERERRLKNNLCLYCGQAGHIRANCPTRPPARNPLVSNCSTSYNRFEVPVTLSFDNHSIETTALVDSGAAGNFIDSAFARAHHLPILSCTPHVAVAALDGRPLGSGRINHTTQDLSLLTNHNHQETIRLFIISAPQTPLILGYPWLWLHSPTISWAQHTITQWSDYCHQHCLRPPVCQPSSPSGSTTDIPEALPTEYQDLRLAFSKSRASSLPPHRPGDCAIDLLPGAVPPKGRIFPLSQPESEAMKEYIQEELKKGFIRPSTSPASAGFFFVKKKDGGLRPCIDYRGLNEVTIKYRYPLPLVPSALEHLRTARHFTKLDLRSAYNLIRIREGDEWKTAFSTSAGHYEYLVMPFGLSNSPSCFQAFINVTFRDMLNRWVIVYIDDILIYSETLEDHVRHVRAVLQRLIQHQLSAKAEKCEFHQSSISFLGYVISPEGVAMDDQKEVYS
ncbi:hypothetical protein QQF64_011994 [Cirrhinus molitorella]|uniref:ribonuclease H n=1 Tax=Cirrhinus molitorella TaxID=172907 RepID=A0ABR3LXF2_9TELE